MFDNFAANIVDYVNNNPYLLDTLTSQKSSLALIGQMLIGFVGEMYVLQIFFFLQFGKLSLNNVNWFVDMIGHFCNDGRPIDADHKLATKFCNSRIHEKLLSFLANAIKYHVSLLTELN